MAREEVRHACLHKTNIIDRQDTHTNTQMFLSDISYRTLSTFSTALLLKSWLVGVYALLSQPSSKACFPQLTSRVEGRDFVVG